MCGYNEIIMITVNQALELVQNNITPLDKKEQKMLPKANGFVLFEDVYSPINMPPFRQSAMDGYALCLHNEQNYNVIDEVKAGDSHHPTLNKGEAARIFTGAPVPDTANCIVIQEHVIIEDNKIVLEKAVSPNDNIRPLGEQVKKGEVALKKNSRLNPAAIGYLTSLGITKVSVYKNPSIAIVVTGDELIEAGQSLKYGEIYESNSGMLLTSLNSLGYTQVSIHKIRDNYRNTFSTIKELIAENDLVLITGGISVGDYDFVGKALQDLNVEQIFYKVKQKPGKPFFFGKKKNTLVFALPGNPAAVLSCFYVYIHPALQRLSGEIDYSISRITVKSNSDYIKKGDRAGFLKADLRNGKVTILEGQNSSMLQTFALANALLYVPAEVNNVLIDDIVEVICLPV